MPKAVKELSATEVKRLKYKVTNGTPKPAYHAVGGVSGLLLQCRPPREPGGAFARSWILRTVVGSKRRDIGLGGYPEVTLAMARDKARELKEQIRQGVDPILERKAAKSALVREQGRLTTFEEMARDYIEKKSAEYKTAKQAQKLTTQLEKYVLPHLGSMFVADIQMSHVVDMLKPIWAEKTETATRVRLHVEKILDSAIADGKRTDVNPARWRGMLEHSTLPIPGKVSKVQHYNALPVDDMATFWEKLAARDDRSSRALQFIILTASRSGEVRGAKWEEIDLKKKVWTVPADRMKAGKPHAVPLSPEAVALLESLPRDSEFVFPGGRGGKLSDVIVSKVPKKLGYDVTAHGFRSTFKDWARQHTAYADEVSELALAHVNNDKTRAAYARDGLLEKRRRLMADWATYCKTGKTAASASVTPIRAAGE